MPPLSYLFTLAGIGAALLSTFLAFGLTRVTRGVLLRGDAVKRSAVAAGALAANRLNLWGMAATLLGLQVAKYGGGGGGWGWGGRAGGGSGGGQGGVGGAPTPKLPDTPVPSTCSPSSPHPTLQAMVGNLVASTLTSATTNPFAAAQARGGAPSAINVFSIQAATNTLLAHFASLVFSAWVLRVLQGAAGAGPASGYSAAQAFKKAAAGEA